MTTGSFTNDSRTSQLYYLNGAPEGSKLIGDYQTKSWSGGDSVPKVRQDPGPKRYYTIVGSSGKVIRKSFRERPPKRTRALAPNYYEMSAVRASIPAIDFKIEQGATSQRITGAAWDLAAASSNLPHPPEFSANDDIKLILKLKELTRGSDFNMSVFLGEGHQVLRMIGDTATKLANSALALKKGNVLGAIEHMSRSEPHRRRMVNRLPKWMTSPNARREVQSRFSSAWLATMYGWLPLLSDMRSGAELLAHKLNVPARTRYMVRSRLKAEINPAYQALGWADGHSVRSKQIVAYVQETESIPKLLGVLDPELVLWELTPFSFVADWVSPIGSWLEARAYASGLTGTFVTTEVMRRAGFGLVGKAYDSGLVSGVSTVYSGGVVYQDVHMSREVSTSLQVPMPVVKPLSKVASWQHCLNGIALVAQVFGGARTK